MKKLIVLVSLFGLVGCQDAQMNLGPEEATATGGSAGGTNVTAGSTAGQTTGGAGGTATPVGGAGGTATPVGGAGGTATPVGGAGGTATPVGGAAGMGATAGTAFAGGTAGEGGEGGIAGEGGEGGGTTFHGIDLEGLQRFTFTVSGGMPANSNGVCRGWEPEIHTLDLATKTLTFEHCAVATDGVTATRIQESRIMADAELTAAIMYLKLISTDFQPSCGVDKPTEVLELDFGDRTATYEDDFYSNCSWNAARGVTFVRGLDTLWRYLQDTLKTPAIPTDYDELKLYISPPRSVLVEPMYDACNSSDSEAYFVDLSTGTLRLVGCSYFAAQGRFAPYEKSMQLTAADTISIRASVAALQFGANDDCSQELSTPLLDLFKNGTDLARVVGEHAPCTWTREQGFVSVLKLDALHTLLLSLINPPV